MAEERSKVMASTPRRSKAAIVSGTFSMASSVVNVDDSPLVVQQVSSMGCACAMKGREARIAAMIVLCVSIMFTVLLL